MTEINETVTSFDPENNEHKGILGQLLRDCGVLPGNIPLATAAKNALKGAELPRLPVLLRAFLDTQAPVQPMPNGITIRRGCQKEGWMVCLYGQPGVGKSTLASQAPSPLFCDVEGGVARINCASILTPDWLSVERARDYFASQSEFQTLVIDTADVLEKKLWQHLCRTRKWASIEAPGYGRGYAEALETWVAFLEKCREIAKSGKNIIFTAHSEVKTFLNPEGESYDRHNMKLHTKVSEHFFGQMDGVFFCHFDSTVRKNAGGDMVAIATGERLIACSDTLTAQVKNRFGLQGKVPLQGTFFSAIK